MINSIEYLQLKESSQNVLVMNAPKYFLNYLDDNKINYDSEVEQDLYNFILIFGISNEEIMQYASLYIDFLSDKGSVLLGYPKKESKNYRGTNCNYNTVADLLLEYNFRVDSAININDDFNGLSFMSK